MSTELEQLFNATAVQSGRPVDLSLVTGRIARRRQARMSATFAGALAAAAFAFSLVGDTLPTSAPVIGEVPPADRVDGDRVSIGASDRFDGGIGPGSARAGSFPAAASSPAPASVPAFDGGQASRSSEDGRDPGARPGWLADWGFEEDDQGWVDESPGRRRNGAGTMCFSDDACALERVGSGWIWDAGGWRSHLRWARDDRVTNDEVRLSSPPFAFVGGTHAQVRLVGDLADDHRVHRLTVVVEGGQEKTILAPPPGKLDLALDLWMPRYGPETRLTLLIEQDAVVDVGRWGTGADEAGPESGLLLRAVSLKETEPDRRR